MKRPILHESAQLELRAATSYYDEKRRGLGLEFQETIEVAIAKICESPKLYSPYEDDLRKFTVGRFPYAIYYLELADIIWIVAIAHQSRLPNYWMNRVDLSELS